MCITCISACAPSDLRRGASPSVLLPLRATERASGSTTAAAARAERGGSKRAAGDGLPTSSSAASLGDAAGGVFKQLRQGGGSLVGKSIEGAGLRGLPDVFLVTIERGAHALHAVAPSEVLQAGDVLWFAGSTDGVISLRKIPGAALNAQTLPSGVPACCHYVLRLTRACGDAGRRSRRR